MTTLYFVRHGQTLWNQTHRMQGFKNSPLTAQGEQQADQLGRWLANDTTIARLLVSPSPRAQQTATYLNHHLHKPMITIPELQELNMGTWEGQTHDWIAKTAPTEWHRFWHDPDHYQGLNGGETFTELTARATHGFHQAQQRYPNQTLVIVSHRVTLRVLLAKLLQQPINAIPDPKSTSLTKLTLLANTYQIDFLNQTLPTLAEKM